MENRTILHVDMDAFYASVEKNRKDLEGPVVVCVFSGRSEDSGAVSTCSYEARELGIHAAMPITRAKQIAEESGEEVQFVAMDKEYYRDVSDRIREEVLSDYSDTIEQASIDEAYMALDQGFEDAIETAEEVQVRTAEEFDLTCSIGVAPNKLVSKIASDQEKPNGLTVVREDEISGFMNSLDLEEVHGIGSRSVEKLEKLGISSVEELAEADTSLLIREFGENLGLKLKDKAQGRDDSRVEEQDQKQITRITTLGENSSIPSYIEKYFPDLADEIIDQAQEKGFGFRKVSLIVVDTDIEMHTKTETLKSHVQEKEVIVDEEEKLLDDFLAGFDGEVRRIGLRISDLKEVEDQSSLEQF